VQEVVKLVRVGPERRPCRPVQEVVRQSWDWAAA